MKNIFFKFLSLVLLSVLVTGCARDLSSSTYTSDSTLNIVFSGQIVSARKVKVKESDKVEAGGGALLGGIGGAAVGATSSGGNKWATVGGAAAGAVFGAVAQNALGTKAGMEYIVKVDTSKLSNDYYEGSALMRNALAAIKATGIITVVQAAESKNDIPLSVGQNALVIVSDKRARVIIDTTR